MGLADRLVARSLGPQLAGRRVVLRPLVASDFYSYQEVRRRCARWLLPWEPLRPSSAPDAAEHRRAFESRCEGADRERTLGAAYRFGIFVRSGHDNLPDAAGAFSPAEAGGALRFVGEVNVGSIQRGAFQNAYIGYWIDEAVAGRGLMPESVAVALAFCFEELGLHRVQISIIPRNGASRRVVEKLQIRCEGLAERYLEINGVWEDHLRFAITAEEWQQRRGEFIRHWFRPHE